MAGEEFVEFLGTGVSTWAEIVGVACLKTKDLIENGFLQTLLFRGKEKQADQCENSVG
jgi:hypothetical protein